MADPESDRPEPSRASGSSSRPLGVALVASSPASAAAEPAPPRPKLHRCDLGMPRPFECGHIMVPVRRGHPALGKTKVAFAIRHRRDLRQPSLGTIFAMDGGPGYASTAKPYASSLIAALGPILRRRDLVLYDMRGTGLSDAIDCPALQAGLIQESIAIGECANQLGPSFAGYTSGEAADDMNQVRRALGLGKIFFYGDSYGTFFGQAYAVRHPGTLRGLILDSAYPGNDPYYRTLLPAGLHGLRLACRYSSTCSGDPVARLTRVVHAFHQAGRPTEQPDRLPARGGDAGAALLPQPRRRRPPLPRRRTAPPRPAAGAGTRRRKALRIQQRPGDRGRMQRLPSALGQKRAVLTADRRTLGVGEEASARLHRALRSQGVPPLDRREAHPVPLLARAARRGACRRRSRATGPRRGASRPWSPRARSTT